jgi:methylmalonyl-CoA mutase
MEPLQLKNELHVLDDFPAVGYAEWKGKATADLKGVPFEKKMITHTYDELEIQPLYTAQSWASAADPSGFPGIAPYTRGVTPLGQSLAGWDVRREVLKPTPAEANAAACWFTAMRRGCFRAGSWSERRTIRWRFVSSRRMTTRTTTRSRPSGGGF